MKHGWMDGWMREFDITLVQIRPNTQAGTKAMTQVALVARMKFLSNIAVRGLNPAPEVRSSGRLPLSYGPTPKQ